MRVETFMHGDESGGPKTQLVFADRSEAALLATVLVPSRERAAISVNSCPAWLRPLPSGIDRNYSERVLRAAEADMETGIGFPDERFGVTIVPATKC
jgi:hypothetical protein